MVKENWQYGPAFIQINKNETEIVIGSGYGQEESAGSCLFAEFLEEYCDYRNQIKNDFGETVFKEVITSIKEILNKDGCLCFAKIKYPTENEKLVEIDCYQEPECPIEIIVYLYKCKVCGQKWKYTLEDSGVNTKVTTFEKVNSCAKKCFN